MMGKSKLIDVAVVTVETKLDKVGALRNTTVVGDWHTIKQCIEQRKWQEADSVLTQLQESLQKINLLKSLTKPCAKLRSAFDTPDTLVEETEYVPKETTKTPRKDQLQIAKLSSELETIKNDTAAFTGLMQSIRITLEKEGNFPEKIEPPKLNSEDLRICLKVVASAGETFQKISRISETTMIVMSMNVSGMIFYLQIGKLVALGYKVLGPVSLNVVRLRSSETANIKKQMESIETKYKESEGSVSKTEEQIQSLTKAIGALEKKNETRKAEKMDTFKDHMKLKSLERLIETKEAELVKCRADKLDLQESVNKISSSKSSELAELGNPYPPKKLAERYNGIFQKEWADAFNKQQTVLERDEKSAIERLLQILQETFVFCKERAENQLMSLMSELVLPGETTLPPESPAGSNDLQSLDDFARKQLANIRKQTSKVSLEFVKNVYITQLEEANEEVYTFQEITECLPYIEACLDVCWHMLLQTPPIHVRFEPTLSTGTLFNKEKYDYYSHKGSKIECVVWPPLFYANRKVLLTKGVAIAELYR